MEQRTVKMKSIWYFVGLVLLTMGIVVCITGIMDLISPPAHTPILAELHSGIWWGTIMLIAGAIFFFANRGKKIEEETK